MSSSLSPVVSVGSATSPIHSRALLVRNLPDVKVEVVAPAYVLALQPMHDGHHLSAASSKLVEELHELRPAAAADQRRITQRVLLGHGVDLRLGKSDGQ